MKRKNLIVGSILLIIFFGVFGFTTKKPSKPKRILTNIVSHQKSITLNELLPSNRNGSRFTIQEIRDYLARGNTLSLSITYANEIGCPVSVFLAQDILESNLRRSTLCNKTGNHGNIKCTVKPHWKCKKGCVKAYDKIERSYSYYVKIDKDWKSWRAKTNILKRYKVCVDAKNKGIVSFQQWSDVFHKSPYATDRRYGKKLEKIILDYGLNYIDEAINNCKVIKSCGNGVYTLYNPN